MRIRAKGKGQRAEQNARISRFILILSFLLPSALIPHPCLADRQNDVFNGISQNVGQEVDPNMILGLALAVAALAGVIVVLSNMRKRTVTNKALNHHGKLLKEISKTFNLKPVEVRQLKILADQQQLSSPLVLLLCPSLLSKSLKERSNADRAMVGQIAKRLIGKNP